jgi:hypothetical protein
MESRVAAHRTDAAAGRARRAALTHRSTRGTGQDGYMEMTGWVTGQVFLQTVDEQEVQQVSAFLNARGIAFQMLTLSERMGTDPTDPQTGVSTDHYSIAVQLAGFPQVVGPALNELIQRAHGGGWALEAS